MQYCECELAWWFNVGVQIFLCLSGYLYGRKEIDDELLFYKKQFIKILVPYYIVVTLAILAQLLFAKNEISFTHIAKASLCYGTLSGGEHLWFIPTILFCYILTPLFNKINNRLIEKKHPFMYCVLAFAMLSIVIKLFVPYFNPAWIACFYLGHIWGKNEMKQRISHKLCKRVIYFGTVSLVSIQITISYILKLEMAETVGALFNIVCDYGHVFLGVSIMLILLDTFRGRMIPYFIMKTIAFLDSISYEGYLVHQFFILGAFSLLTIIGQPILAIMAIFTVVFSCGFVLKLVNRKVSNFIR